MSFADKHKCYQTFRMQQQSPANLNDNSGDPFAGNSDCSDEDVDDLISANRHEYVIMFAIDAVC